MENCPLVFVEWEDSRQPDPAWNYLTNRDGTVVRCASVGWLIRDDDVKELAPNMGDVTTDEIQVCGVISIPARCVLKITRLEEPEITAFSDAASSSRPGSEPTRQAAAPLSALASSRPTPFRPE